MMPRALQAVVVVGTGAAAAAAQPTFSTKIAAVRVDVSVTERGQPVRGLRSADFEVRDNGVRQQIELVSFEQLPLNVLMALDMSDSVSGERLRDLRAAGAAVLDSLSPDDQAALLTFSHGLRLGGGLTGDLKRLRGALDEAVPSGDTALYDAAYVAMMLGEQSPGRDLLVVFSDGRDTASWLSADQVVDAARRADVVAYGLALRDPASRRFLRRLADETGGEAIELDSTSNLRARFLSVLEGFRQRYLISYTPSGVTRSGWHRLEVRVAGRRATVRARPGYFER